MKLQRRGKNILKVEVQNISKHGIWLYANGMEYFLSFKDYPWFKQASISSVQNVKCLFGVHLYWPDIDVDLELGSLLEPNKYPLVYR